eukprot:m.15815 g.15815  ORF g.15815 m.15815 type:complete len:52 (+) comp6774_c0_seq1:65-220(+)
MSEPVARNKSESITKFHLFTCNLSYQTNETNQFDLFMSHTPPHPVTRLALP